MEWSQTGMSIPLILILKSEMWSKLNFIQCLFTTKSVQTWLVSQRKHSNISFPVDSSHTQQNIWKKKTNKSREHSYLNHARHLHVLKEIIPILSLPMFQRSSRPHLADLSNKEKLSSPTFLTASSFQNYATKFSSSAYLCTSDFAVFMQFMPGCHFRKNITTPPTSHHMEASYCIVPPGTWILHLEVQLHLLP